VLAARRLARGTGDRPDVELLDGGTLSFTLLPTLEIHHRLIVLDAAELGAVPGTVEYFESAAMDEFLGRPRRSVHEVGLCDLLNMARLSGCFPARRALVGVQPGFVGWRDSLSQEVAAALDRAAGLALSLLDRWDREDAPDRADPRLRPILDTGVTS
jgi:hydrogenase maturation protease